MKSPYQRLIEVCGVTQKNFQEAFGFSKPTLIQIMSGQYANLSDRMITSLGRLCAEKSIDARSLLEAEYEQSTLQDAYHAWQRAERKAVAEKYQEPPPLVGPASPHSPFDIYVLRTAGSQARFCKDLKVDAARVREYANGKSAAMPYVIREALQEIEYPWLETLETRQSNWRTQ